MPSGKLAQDYLVLLGAWFYVKSYTDCVLMNIVSGRLILHLVKTYVNGAKGN